MKLLLRIVLSGFVFFITAPAFAAKATFDDLTPTVSYSGGHSYENGQNLTPVSASQGSYGEIIHHNVFTSGGASFVNHYIPDWGAWDGWAYSNTKDLIARGLGNQYSAYMTPGGGGHDSDNYGVFFEPFGALSPTITFSGPVTLTNVWITNSTYAYHAVVNGEDGNSPPFVKGPFAEGDWFKVTVWGYGDQGQQTHSLDIYLADYRDSNPANWYALSSWTLFDLSILGTVYGIGFDLSSSDASEWGMNTPAYFAMDDLGYSAVPIPGSVILLASGLTGLFGIKRKEAFETLVRERRRS